MANEMVKAQRIVRTALGLLEREIVLPSLVWQDPVGDFAGALGDTVSIRLPAYTSARTRVLRGGTPITMDELTETKVDVSLDTDVYKAVPITDEELTLDIADFGEQVLEPVVRSVARGIEDQVAAEMEAATYPTVIEIANTGANPVYDALIDARKALNNASVPAGGRALVVGSDIEAKLTSPARIRHSVRQSSGASPASPPSAPRPSPRPRPTRSTGPRTCCPLGRPSSPKA
jgi:hypothetical protein